MRNGYAQVAVIGDVVGEPGRKALFLLLSRLVDEHGIDFVIANGENAAGGFGLTANLAGKLHSYGVDCLTTGNHVWRNPDIFKVIDTDPRLLRPANYPSGTPGKGWTVIDKNGLRVGVLNLQGRVFMEPLDNPFRTAKKLLSAIRKETNIILVDFHAEATSEKVALGWYLDGMVSAVVGTHTHVQTADERVLPGGTAYCTDIGMTGPADSVIGIRKEIALKKFVDQLPSKFIVAENDVWLNGVIVSIDPGTGQTVEIRRVSERAI